MSEIEIIAHQARLRLGSRVSEVMETALACTPAGGTSPKWRTLMDELDVRPLEEGARSEAAKQAGQTRGAPVAEVARCLESLVASVRGESSQVVEVLQSLLDGLVSRHKEQYAVLATVPTETVEAPAKAGGMFAFAMATAKKKSEAQQYGGGTYLLHCPSCGAPRLRESDLVCEYCGERTTS